jgi:hypothetical protein
MSTYLVNLIHVPLFANYVYNKMVPVFINNGFIHVPLFWEFVRSIQEQIVEGDAVKFVCREAKQMY